MPDVVTIPDPAFGEADLTTCDREPIHIPGSIQSYGVLLTVDRRDFVIRQFAGDTKFLLGIEPHKILQLSLYSLFSEQVLLPIAERLRLPSDLVLPSTQPGIVSRTGALPLDVTVHVLGNQGIIELEPARRPASFGRDPLIAAKQMLAAVGSADSLDACCVAAARTLREVTGFDRVMIYEFLHDGSGKVIAEDKATGIESFLGLHFPASDIPRQARELYRRNWLRMIPDIEYKSAPLQPPRLRPGEPPLDMSHCYLRSVSPLHLEYLRNMGVHASMSVSIILGDKLWGLIACHHHTPYYISADFRIACELFAQVFSLQLEVQIEASLVQRRLAAQRVHNELTVKLLRNDDMAASLVDGDTTLLDLLPAPGAAVWLDGRLVTIGKVPPTAVIEKLITGLDALNQPVFQTEHVATLFPAGAEHVDTASGLLAIASERLARDYVLWFRPEVRETVTWSGRPGKVLEVGPFGERLTPRKSFEAWRMEVRGRSVPWSRSDLDIALAFRITLLETILRQVDIARREREAVIVHQNMLMGELDHRVKNTLATILALVGLTKSSAPDFESYVLSLQHRIRAMASAHELLADKRWQGLSLRTLLIEEVAPFAAEPRVSFLGDNVVLTPRAALSLALVVHELVTNSVKYGALSSPAGHVAVTWQPDADANLVLEWIETGGPRVVPPERRGFGSMLIERSIRQDVNGSVTMSFEPDGLACRLSLPLEKIVAGKGN